MNRDFTNTYWKYVDPWGNVGPLLKIVRDDGDSIAWWDVDNNCSGRQYYPKDHFLSVKNEQDRFEKNTIVRVNPGGIHICKKVSKHKLV